MATFKYDDFILRFTNVTYDAPPGETGLAPFFLGIKPGESMGLSSETNSGTEVIKDLLFGLKRPKRGQIMYYGRTIDELAPVYMRENYRHLKKQRGELEKLQKDYITLENKVNETKEPSQALLDALEDAKDAFTACYFNFVQLQGGFVNLDQPDILAPYYSKRYDLALEYREIVEEIEASDASYRDLEARRKDGSKRLDHRLFKLSEEMDDLQAALVEVQWEIEEVLGFIDSWKEPYINHEEFIKHERELDESISLFRLTPAERRLLFRDIQYVPTVEKGVLRPEDTFGEVLEAGLVYQGLYQSRSLAMKQYLSEWLDYLDLKKEDLVRPVYTASKLEAFKLLLGRSLVLHPKVLYLDEPLRNLAKEDKEIALDFLSQLRDSREITMIIASQDVETLADLTDRCAIMCEGHLVELYNTESMMGAPFHPYTAALIASHRSMDFTPSWTKFRLSTDEGNGSDYKSEACPFYRRCTLADETCKVKPELSMVESGHFYACHHSIYGGAPQRL